LSSHTSVHQLHLYWITHALKVPESMRRYLSLIFMLGAVFGIDWYTYELSVGPLYLLLVVYARWQLGLRAGLLTAVACPILWAVADYGTGHRFAHTWILLENAGVRMFTYCLIVGAVSIYKKTLEAHRRRLAMLERLLSVCPGCGAIGVNEGGWRKASEFHNELAQVYTLCPTCSAVHQPDVAPDTSRTASG
jgi:hypothetical protein